MVVVVKHRLDIYTKGLVNVLSPSPFFLPPSLPLVYIGSTTTTQ